MPAHEGELPIRSLAVIANQAFSIVNFRGPLIEAMVAAGVRVHALAPDYDGKTRAAVARLGAEPVDISLERVGTRPLRDALDMLKLARLLRRLRPDASFGYFIKPVIYGSLAAKLAGVKHRYALVAGLGHVFAEEKGFPLGPALLRKTVSALYRVAFAACNRVFFQNDEDIAHFVEAGLLNPAKAVRLNGTGVDLQRLAPAPPVTEPVRFILMARLLRDKGILEYAAAARIVKRCHPEVEFVLLGGLDTNPAALSRAEVEDWVGEGLLEWQGHVDDVSPWLARASVFVLPSYYREGVPRSAQEAMAMARPVITTDNVGCRNTVDHGVNGFLVPVRDVEALASAMLRFVDEPALIARMGLESRRIAEARFDVHVVNRIILGEMGLAGIDERRPNPMVSAGSGSIYQKDGR